jgi:hypothetical protein
MFGGVIDKETERDKEKPSVLPEKSYVINIKTAIRLSKAS